MQKLVFFLLTAIALGTVPAIAGSECLECKGPYGLTYQVWGNRCPQNTTHTNTLTPLSCGVETLKGDPFFECTASNPNHKTWVGGSNSDLIAIATASGSLGSATVFRLQDGTDLGCGADVQQRSHFTAVRYGNNRDILDIYAMTPESILLRSTFRIQDGYHHGLVVGDNYVARLYGAHKDIIRAYFIRSNGIVVQSDEFRIQDGRDHQIVPLTGSTTDFGIIYGNNDDVRARVCFLKGEWKIKLNQRDGTFPASCE